MSNLTQMQRCEIVFLNKYGLNISEIAEELKLTRNTVRFWTRRYEEEGHLNDRARAPRPRLITPDQIDRMLATYDKHPHTSTRVFAEEFNCTTQLIRRALREAGYVLQTDNGCYTYVLRKTNNPKSKVKKTESKPKTARKTKTKRGKRQANTRPDNDGEAADTEKYEIAKV